MHKTLASIILLCSILFSVQLVALVTPGQLLFKTSASIQLRDGKTGLTGFDSFLSTSGLKSISRMKGMPSTNYYLANVSIMPDAAYLGKASFPGIEYVQPNFLRKLHLIPNDTRYGEMLHYVSSVPEAWNHSTGSTLIKVGIVDSGVLVNHPDLQANIYVNHNEIPDNGIDDDGNGYIDDWCGWDFADAPEMSDIALGDYIDQDNTVEDENFHGTHVAGIVGAVGNNSLGVAGVCWNVSLMPLRAGFRTTSGTGYLQDDDAAAAIVYAADNGCNVINMSWGDPNYSPIISDACEYAFAKGVTLIASAGNDATDVLSYPAKLSCVISVGSVNKAKQLSGFSSYGVDLDLVAVGEQVLSTYKLEGEEQYFVQNGTSMSSPYVAGSAALLLSLQPGLSPQEVRARLLSSTDDLDPPGFDIKTGHGLLNTKKLLENLNPPYVEITSPLDQMGVSTTVPIIGSVYGEDFFRYTLCFSNLSDPTIVGWYDVSTHTLQPTMHTTEVHNGELGVFYIPPGFPEGIYLIRLQFEKRHNNILKYNYYRTIVVDRSAPELIAPSLYGFQRYEKQNLRYYISAKFNEKVNSQLMITDVYGGLHTVYSSIQDSLQIWAIPSSVPQGQISIQIKATNSANLTVTSQMYQDFMNIAYSVIPSFGYTMADIGTTRRPLNRMKDFNGNGIQEYIAMEMPKSGYGTVKVYEPHVGGHVETHSFDSAFWPLDFANTNNSGDELLFLNGDTVYLWETGLVDTYPNPNLAIWSDTGISGGLMADYDSDGLNEILVVKNLSNERVIQAYKRNANGALVEKHKLSNPTPTNLRNNFVPTVLVDNLDGDATKDVLCADTDGDVLVYEIVNANVSELRWTTRLPVGNVYQLAIGDFDGNGNKDFFVGGYNSNSVNPNLSFWYFEAFTRAANNIYTSMGSIMFNDVISQNSITAKDLDNDGKDEVILALAPNLYILKLQDGKFTPSFHGESFSNYQVSTWTDTAGTVRILANVKAGADSSRAVQWSPQAPFTGPNTPANVTVKPLNESSIRISWITTGAPAYRVYRKDDEDLITYFDVQDITTFTDVNVSSGRIYNYAVSALDPTFTPEESIPSLWSSGIPMPVPTVENIEIVGIREIRVTFNQAMPPDFINPGYYFLSDGMGIPLSANSVYSHWGIQLRFRETFPVVDSLFLELRNLTGGTGVDFLQNRFGFAYEEDISAPQIETVTVLDSKQGIVIKYSEELASAPVSYLPNFVLTCPDNDPDNNVVSAILTADIITINFAETLKHTNGAYYIETENLTDLAGNMISPQHKLVRFNLASVAKLKDVNVFPNPVTHKHTQEAIFTNFPTGKDGNIAIYNSAGNLVFKSAIGPFNAVSNNVTWTWNLKNNDRRPVSSGVYFYVIEMGGDIERGKLAVIK
ncbi:MAG: S8 family serine peptidase [Candidatus Cloacimonetes bacterium]|nr:S8 family serine peptidase [Candidatus Cloacimonadota bacterium]